MKPMRMAIAAALLGAAAVSAALAQQAASPQTIRLRGTIEKLDGRVVLAKSSKGEELTLKLADKALVVAIVKASPADIKPGLFIGSGAMPQPDGSQKALEVHIYAESMRGTAEAALGRRSQFHHDQRHRCCQRFQRRWTGGDRSIQGR
jgi:hypothetical protein